jgi:hypothetical protein
MTIAISLKVNDGIVLAADSATTIYNAQIGGVVNIYNSANKIFNLYKGLPIGAITWGSGSIGQSSISTLAKDFRELITNDKNERIDPENYTIEEVAKKFKKFIYDKHYKEFFQNFPLKPSLGFMIVGFSKDCPEEWMIKIDQEGKCSGPFKIRVENEIGMTWNGEPKAITRLYCGYSPFIVDILKKCNVEENKIKEIIRECNKNLIVPMISPAMPIQDAIDLANFLVETTINFSRFSPGVPTVGGPIEIAAITKHEGFKWIKRKHYYTKELNPD